MVENGRMPRTAGRPAKVAATCVGAFGTLFGCVLGGCAHDCDQSYCDMVRAGATGWFAHELQCCREPGLPDCDVRSTRLVQFNLLAAEMRAACEAQNLDRFRELWNDGWRLLPAIIPLLVADEFCDGWDWSGLNNWTPFHAEDSAAAALMLDPGPPRLRVCRGGTPGLPLAEVARPMVERDWTIRPGSMVSVSAFGVDVGFAANGSLSVVEMLENPDILPGDDVESWCRRMKPRAFTLDLETSGGTVTLRLDPRFQGSHVRFDSPDGGVIGLGVSMQAAMAWPGSDPFELAFEGAYLEVPFVMAADGTLTLLPDGAVSMLDLMPVDPVVEAWIRGEDPVAAADGGEVDCIAQAQAVAEAYLSFHSDCDVSAD